MDQGKLEDSIKNSRDIVTLLRHGRSREGWAAFSRALPALQETILLPVQEGLLEEGIAALLLNDILAAMENQDGVLLADTLQNGVNGLLAEILDAGKEGLS